MHDMPSINEFDFILTRSDIVKSRVPPIAPNEGRLPSNAPTESMILYVCTCGLLNMDMFDNVCDKACKSYFAVVAFDESVS